MMWDFAFMIVGMSISVALCYCVGSICDAWKHKYIWMYEGHQERDERYVHEKVKND